MSKVKRNIIQFTFNIRDREFIKLHIRSKKSNQNS